MPPGISGSGGFMVQPTSLDYAARLMENIGAEFERLAASLSGAFEAARSGAGEPDLERCLSLAALDFGEFTRGVATAAREEARRLRAASLDYTATDQDAAAGFDLVVVPGAAAPVETPSSTGGPQ
jgi:hypothetical protein